MANTPNSIVSPQNVVIGHADLTAATGLTSRAPITGTTGLTQLVPVSGVATADTYIAQVSIKGISSNNTAPTAAQLVGIWDYDGTTSHLLKEIVVAAVTPSTTVGSFESDTVYASSTSPGIPCPIGHAIYVSTTVTTTASTTAIGVTAYGSSN